MPLGVGDPEAIGGYRLLDRLGSGGMGVVYQAQSASGRLVAVKLVHTQFAADDEFRVRFRQEVAAARRVSGAFTAPVVDAAPDAERPWMATLYVPGPTLAERLADGGPLDAPEMRQLALGLAEALHDIHRVGVIHRDLKPANVLMAEDGPRVIDFGISRAADFQALTMTGRVMGTPPFMSPEGLTRPREVTAASDVFSLGALLVYAATGHGPFDADSPYLTAYQVVHEPPALDELTDPLRGIVARCLAKDPAARPGLPELMALLHTLPKQGPLRIEGGSAGPAPGTERGPAEYEPTSPGKRRRRTTLAALTALVTLALGGGGVALYMSSGYGVRASQDKDKAATPRQRMPAGWRPWEVSLIEHGGTMGADDEPDPRCVANDDALYCGGLELPVVRLDMRTGRTEWRNTDQVNQDDSSSSTAPFDVSDTLVYLHDSQGAESSLLLALDAGSGRRVWARSVSAARSMLVGGLVLTTDMEDTSLIALDARTGRTRWQRPFPTGTNCTVVPVAELPHLECWDSSDGYSLLRVNPKDGGLRSLARLEEFDEPLGLYAGDLYLARAVDETESVYDHLLRFDHRTGSQHKVKLPAGTVGTPYLVADRMFFVQESGLITMVDPATGDKVWSTSSAVERLGRPLVSSADETVYLASSSGRLLALDLNTGEELWQTTARSRYSGQTAPLEPLLVRGAVVGMANDGTVFTVDPADPEASPEPTPRSATSRPSASPRSAGTPASVGRGQRGPTGPTG